MSSCRAGIFIATMTGTAEMCAEEISLALDRAGISNECRLMDALSAAALEPYQTIIIVSSTYGHGDVPDNGQTLFASIAHNGDLGGRRFAVFGLGDMTYAATFCAAGRKWDDLLESKGGVRIAPLMQHDAASGTLAEDIAGAWAAAWSEQALKAA